MHLQVPETCMSLSFSPTGEFLATAHRGNRGIFLWSNRMLFSHISLKAVSKDNMIPEMELPGVFVETEKSDNNDDVVAAEPDYVSPDQLDANLITMSAVVQSRWQNLLDIDIIKQRNKPKQAPKALETAPFFLPTIPSLDLRFDFSHLKTNEKADKQSVNSVLQNVTSLSKSLESVATDDFSIVVERLKTMSASAIDFEIQSLSLDEISSELLLLQFMKMIHFMMERQVDFELSQAYLAVFLKWHGTTLTEKDTLRDYLRMIQEVQKKNWHILRDKLFYNISVVQNLKKM